MRKMTTSGILKLTTERAEKNKAMCLHGNPMIVNVAMLVSTDESGRVISLYHPNIRDVNIIIDDSAWPFKPGQQVYHRTLKEVGTFVEVDQLDPTSATVEFVDGDGYKDEKRISLALLTDDIPLDHK